MNLGIRKREAYCLCDIYMYIYFSFFLYEYYVSKPALPYFLCIVTSLCTGLYSFQSNEIFHMGSKREKQRSNHSSTRYHRLNGKEATIIWYVMQTRALFLDITPVLSLLDRVSCDISIGLVPFLWCNILFLYVN